MGKIADNPNTSVSFICSHCRGKWSAEPGRIEDRPEQNFHPWEYFAQCPTCGGEGEWAYWERNIAKAHANATGPKTEAGKAASAANLEGHPTPEEAQRTRFNALKHGIYARTATYFPARPGQYSQCEGCDLIVRCHEEIACLRRTELFMRHHAAFESGDPGMLSSLRSDTQAALQALINDMILAIAEDGGPRIKEIQWYYDKEGDFHLAGWTDAAGDFQQIYELKAHPLIKTLIDLVSKNAMTLADMEMTPKSQDDQATMRGYLEDKRQDQQTLEQFKADQDAKMDVLLKLINNSGQPVGPGQGSVIEGEVTRE